MQVSNQARGGGAALLGLQLAVGLVVGGWILGAEIKAARLADRYVSVRGLAERTVKSDLAIWPIEFKEAGDDLPSLYARTEAVRRAILQFLGEQGIEPSEIQMGIVRVVDNQANEFRVADGPQRRYIVEQRVTVATARVDQVAAGAQRTASLVQQGIVLNSSRGSGLTYKFTGLNAIKPDMITEATRNARAAADRFAMDSSSTVGSIRQANQGIFSILPANSGDAGASPYSYDEESSLMKTVRVVTSVQYYLQK